MLEVLLVKLLEIVKLASINPFNVLEVLLVKLLEVVKLESINPFNVFDKPVIAVCLFVINSNHYLGHS